MQLTSSKETQFSTLLRSPSTAFSSNYDFHHLSQFLSFLLPLLSYKTSSLLNQNFLHTSRPYQPHPSSPIGLERASYLLFTTCRKAEEENKAKIGLLDKSSEVDTNKAHLYFSSKDLGLDINSLSSEDNDDDLNNWEDATPGFKKKT